MAQPSGQKTRPNSSQNIEVVVRVRPLNDEELQKRVKTVVQCTSTHEIRTKDKRYNFDQVFRPESSQMDIYSFVVAPMIKDVLQGYNCTVFAYGQTGTGKTHTIIGGDPDFISNVHWKKDELAGCIPRAAAHIFDEIESMRVNNYNIRVSFLELYNEEVRDLLGDGDHCLPLSIFNDAKGLVCVQNLNEVSVLNANDIYKLLKQGILKRQTASTLTNSHSSRSHTVFTITVHVREVNLNQEDVLKTGKINIVDLAGSENIAKSGVKDKRAQELANINKSLLTLGRVIQILADKNTRHVPYRDSKLTRILQDSLGGHTKTRIIATVSPSHTSYEVTQSTLDYARRARDIKNTPMINERVSQAQMVREMNVAIEKLKKDLDTARSGSGFFVDREDWDNLNHQLQTNSNRLEHKNEIIDEMKRRLSELEAIRAIKEKEYEEIMNAVQHKAKVISKAENLLKQQQLSIKEEQFISSHYLEAVNERTHVAKELMDTAEQFSKNQLILQRKLENQYYNNYTNQRVITENSHLLDNIFSENINKLDRLNNEVSTSIAEQRANVTSIRNTWTGYALKSKTSWEEEILPSLDSDLKGQACLIDHTQSSIQSIIKQQNEIGAIATQLNGTVSTAYSRLFNLRKGKEEVLRQCNIFREVTLKEIEDLDAILGAFEFLPTHFQNKEPGSNNFQPDETLDMVKKLENTLADLELKKQNCLEKAQLLMASNKRVQSNLALAVADNRLNTEAALAQNDTLLDVLEEQAESLRKSVEASILGTRSDLHTADEIRNHLVSNVIPVTRAGDTPKPAPFNCPKRTSEGTFARDVLVKRFREQHSENKENESFHLNVTSKSIESLDESTLPI